MAAAYQEPHNTAVSLLSQHAYHADSHFVMILLQNITVMNTGHIYQQSLSQSPLPVKRLVNMNFK